LATDGLWDNFSSKTSVKVMSEILSSGSKITNYATALIKAAVSGYGHEGASVERMIHSLSIPSTHSRRYRDDITTQVVFFPSSGIEATSGAKEIEKSGAEVHFEKQPRLYQWVGHFTNSPKKPNFQKSKL
jgi:serine/threonine protein phosphatase PrpC